MDTKKNQDFSQEMDFTPEAVRGMLEKMDQERLAKQYDPAEDLVTVYDIPYLPDAKKEHLLDIYYPKEKRELLPVIVDTHGGALIYGYKEINRNFNYELARRGFAVISLNYPLIPEVNLAEQLRSISNALAFIPSLKEQYPLDLKKCILVGDSAGGLLTWMTAALIRNEGARKMLGLAITSLNPSAIGLVSTMSGTLKSDITKTIQDRIKNGTEADEFLEDPMQLIKSPADLPPVWLLTSAEDFIRNESLALRDILEQAGIPYQFVDYPEGSKGYRLDHVFPVSYKMYPESQEAIDQLCNYVKKYI